MLPDLYKDREAMLEEVAELQKRVAMLRMYGPRSREDLELFWFIITGQVRVPHGPIWKWEQWFEGQKDQNAFTAGLFSLRRLIPAYAPSVDSMKRYDVANVANQLPWGTLDARYAPVGQFPAIPANAGPVALPDYNRVRA